MPEAFRAGCAVGCPSICFGDPHNIVLDILAFCGWKSCTGPIAGGLGSVPREA